MALKKEQIFMDMLELYYLTMLNFAKFSIIFLSPLPAPKSICAILLLLAPSIALTVPMPNF